MHNYKELEIWKMSVAYCPKIYKATERFPEKERFGLISQLNRAVVSVPSNIAEGSAKSSDKHFLIFLENALGSCFEIETQLLVSLELGFLPQHDYDALSSDILIIIKRINNFMNFLSKNL
ncbi:four helix bundle protein [Flavobacterium sp.]|jgi:four helix bundle protein|uniref:four helix bundle protein n=1 Tax=Flavobacterium sp. TaxID=239 RepID=UPI003784A493